MVHSGGRITSSQVVSDTIPTVFGGGSIQLARVFGIRIGVDYSWFFVLFLIIWSLSGYYEDVAPGSNAFVLAVISALLRQLRHGNVSRVQAVHHFDANAPRYATPFLTPSQQCSVAARSSWPASSGSA